MKQTLRTRLLKHVLFVLVGSLFVATSWSAFTTWYGGDQGGHIWTSGSTNGSKALIEYWKVGWLQRAELLSDIPFAKLETELMENELIISVAHSNKTPRIKTSFKSKWDNQVDIKQLLEIRSSGFYIVNGALKHVAIQKVANDSDNKKFIVVRNLDEVDFLKHFSSVARSEILLFGPQGDVIDSTLKDRSGRTVLPKIEKKLLAGLDYLKPTEVFTTQLPVEVIDYDGYHFFQGSVFNKGDNRFYAYISIFPITNENGIKAAYLGVLVPSDALMQGVKKVIYGSLILLILICLVASGIIIRLSNQVIQPISIATEKINQISNNLSNSLQLADSPIHHEPPSGVILEIAELQRVINVFERIFVKTEEMRKTMDEERGRAFTSSKMAALGEMAGGIAHEVNSPLATIHTLSGQLQDLMEDGDLDRTHAKEIAAKIEKTSKRIAKIVNGLLSFSRDQSHEPFIQVSVEKIIEDTLAFCSEKFTYHDIQLDTHIPPNLKIECRPSQISQVILNLLNNAYDAVENLKTRWVKIEVLELDQFIKILISDSGPGIPLHVRSKLFQPFFTTKEIGKGTGLGLGISKKIIETHKGTLTLDTELQNTCFVIEVPKV